MLVTKKTILRVLGYSLISLQLGCSGTTPSLESNPRSESVEELQNKYEHLPKPILLTKPISQSKREFQKCLTKCFSDIDRHKKNLRASSKRHSERRKHYRVPKKVVSTTQMEEKRHLKEQIKFF